MPKVSYGSFAAGVLVIAALALAACGGGDSSSDETSSGETSSGEADSGGGSGVKPRTIALVNLGASSPVTAQADEVVKLAAKDLGWKVIYTDAEADPAKAALGVQAAVSQNVEGIITNALSAEYATEALEQAKQRGIPTIQITSGEAQSDLYTAQYGEDETKFGEVLAEYIVEHEPDGKIAELTASILPAGKERNAGLAKVIKGTGVEVVASSEPDITNPVESTEKTVTDMLTSTPSITSVWGVFDNFTPGIIGAIESKNSPAKAYTFFADPAQVELLQKESPLEALVDDEAPRTGAVAMNQLLLHFEKEQDINPKALEEEPLEYKVYDRSNVPPKGEQVWNAEEFVAPYLEKWEKEFPGLS